LVLSTLESWNQADPLTLAQGLAKLESLASRMTKAQKKKRAPAIEKARTFMLRAARGPVESKLPK
jgi:hypothetical protein